MVTIAQVEGIFRRQGWRYSLNEKGDIITAFGEVPMIVSISPNRQNIVIHALVYYAEGTALRAFQAHLNEVDAFLEKFTARISGSAQFLVSRDETGVVFHVAVRFSGSPEDEAEFVDSIGFAEAVAEILRPLVEAIGMGRMSARQAMDIVNRDLAEAERGQRRRSA